MQTCGLTIGAAGCLLTSSTMVFKYYGSSMNPGQVNTCMGTSACPWYFATGANNCSQNKASFLGLYSPNYATFVWALSTGYPPIIEVTKGGGTHWIVINGVYGSGLSDSDYSIIDPLGGYTSAFQITRITGGVKIGLQFMALVTNSKDAKNYSQWALLLTIFAVISNGLWLVLVLAACIAPATPATTQTPPLSPTVAVSRHTATPVLPPAGWIAYLDMEQHLWLVQTDGNARRPVPCEGAASAPAWSPDGRELAYICASSKETQRRAMVYQVTDQHRRVIGPTIEHLSRITWSPDGLHIVLDAGTSIVRNLKVLYAPSGQMVQEVEAIGYAWSPDGRYLAIGQRAPLDSPVSVEPLDSVSLAVVEIGQARPVVVLSGSPEILYFPKAWLPDGRVLYDRLDWDEGNQTGEHALWSVTYANGIAGTPQPATDIPPDYDKTAILERLSPRFHDAGTGSFSWSPDHNWLAFHAGTWPNIEVYLWHWEGNEKPYRLLTGHSPQWQPGP